VSKYLTWAAIFVFGWAVGAITGAFATLTAGDPDLEKTATTVAGFATAFAAVVAAVALFMAWIQILSQRKEQREATAFSIYSEQLRLGLSYPELMKVNKSYIEKHPEEYANFMYHLLYACENIIRFLGEEKEWVAAVKLYMKPHIDYVVAHDVPSDRTLSDPFRAVVKDLIDEQEIGPPLGQP